MTEEAYFSSAAQKDCFSDLGVEEYEIVATLDSHTSDICQTMDGQHFPMKDYQAGVTAPPFHVYCRSTTAPYFDEQFDVSERAARDENGKTYYVPDDMTYKDWEKTFVNGGDKSGLTESGNKSIIKSITVDDIKTAMHGYDVDERVLKTLSDVFVVEDEEFHISGIEFKSIEGGKDGTPLLQADARRIYGMWETHIIVNSDIVGGATLEDIEDALSSTGKNVAKTMYEAAIHERGHAKFIYAHRFENIEDVYAKYKKLGVDGVSDIAKEDGVEAVAEIEVLLDRGDNVSEENKAFYNKALNIEKEGKEGKE